MQAADVSAADTVITTEKPDAKTFRLMIGTNMLYGAALVPNIGIGVMIGDKVSLWADWMHAWWSNRDKRRYWRIYGGDFEARWHFGHGRSANPSRVIVLAYTPRFSLTTYSSDDHTPE